MIASLKNLPLILSLVPLVVWSLSALAKFGAFDWLRGIADILYIVVFFIPVLIFDSIGLISFSVLNTGGPEFMGSKLAAEAVYVATSALILYLIGKLIVKILVKA